MPEMTPTSLVAAVGLVQAKSLKIASNVFERRENLLQNGILHFVIG